MKLIWNGLAGVLALVAAPALAQDDASQFADWPMSRTALSFAVSNAVTVAVALSTNQPVISDRGAVHMSTSMSLGGGRTIDGGGEVFYANCKQEFHLVEILHGKKLPDRFLLEYGFTKKSKAFPGPRTERTIPLNQKVILILGAGPSLLKAVPDNDENRKTIKELHNQASQAIGAPGAPQPER